MMRLSKHHGLGNDFLVALDVCNPRGLVVDQTTARSLCDRRRGVGADGFIHGAESHGADVRMRFFNSDGSRAEMSGNGIRCLAQAVVVARAIDQPADLTVETDAGDRLVRVAPGPSSKEHEVRVDMGEPTAAPLATIDWDRLGVGALSEQAVDMGNPHLVVRVTDPAQVDLEVVGPAVESAYPGGVNVSFVAPEGPDRLAMVVWERGAGVTEACGTGACAAAWAAREWGLVSDSVGVRMPGGEARVELAGSAWLIAPAVLIAQVEVA